MEYFENMAEYECPVLKLKLSKANDCTENMKMILWHFKLNILSGRSHMRMDCYTFEQESIFMLSRAVILNPGNPGRLSRIFLNVLDWSLQVISR